MPIVTRAVFEQGVLRPLEKLDLPENLDLLITIWPLDGDEAEPEQETLADVLGFDPADEVKLGNLARSQQRAFADLTRQLDGLPGSDPPHDGAVHHDKYIYRVDWR